MWAAATCTPTRWPTLRSWRRSATRWLSIPSRPSGPKRFAAAGKWWNGRAAGRPNRPKTPSARNGSPGKAKSKSLDLKSDPTFQRRTRTGRWPCPDRRVSLWRVVGDLHLALVLVRRDAADSLDVLERRLGARRAAAAVPSGHLDGVRLLGRERAERQQGGEQRTGDELPHWLPFWMFDAPGRDGFKSIHRAGARHCARWWSWRAQARPAAGRAGWRALSPSAPRRLARCAFPGGGRVRERGSPSPPGSDPAAPWQRRRGSVPRS